jgi:adenylate kinase family enzyme
MDSTKINTEFIPEVKRICYFLVGKPGSGKSVLAQKLAESLPSVLISPDNVLSDASVNYATKVFCFLLPNNKMSDALRTGKPLSEDFILELMEAKIQADIALFKGRMYEKLNFRLRVGRNSV